MNAADRDRILDSARYLRSVRPLDPEKLREYVDGRPHPAVVRRVLREHAHELALVERADGRFEPAPDGSVTVDYDGTIPAARERAVEDLLVERLGPDWHRGETGRRLRERIRRLKADYYRGRAVAYDADTALAYACYHHLSAYAKMAHAVADCAAWNLFGHRLRVLEVGAGTGGPACALFDLLPGDALVEYHAVEPSPAAAVFDRLVEGGRNRLVTLHREAAETFDPWAPLPVDPDVGVDATAGPGEHGSPGYDLVLFASVLSELDAPVATARRLLAPLAPHGTALLLAPADRETAIGLRDVERALEAPATAADADGTAGDALPTDAAARPYTVFGPEPRLWRDASAVPTPPADEGWSFVARPELSVPSFQARLAEAAAADGATADDDPAAAMRNVAVRYAYSVLRRDDRRRVAYTPDPDRIAPLADSEHHVTDRIDVVAFKLSDDLAADRRRRDRPDAEAANPLFRIGDGSQRTDHYAVLTEPTSLNRALTEAVYGRLLAFEGVLVLWNADEGAYNLVVDAETVVDRLG